jgi:molybdopterin-binding protein
MLKGRVAEISGSDSTVRLKIDAGKMLVTQITKRSFEEMGLNPNAEVYLTFKASNVQIL